MASPEVADIFGFDAQLIVWGAAWWGDLADPTAMLAEAPEHIQRPMWDGTKADLDSQVLISEDGVSRPPDSWALPYSWDWKRLTYPKEGHGT